MYCFQLSPWITLRGQSSVATITQGEATWLDLRGFEDFVAWLEVKEVTLGGATHVTLTYQTSPTKDESLFAAVATAINLDTVSAASPPVNVTAVLKDSATTPLARWLRFQLGLVGTATTAWDATFRVWIAANIGATPKQIRGRMPQAPPVRQTGKTCNGDCMKGGSVPIAPAHLSMAGRPPTSVTAGGSRAPGFVVPR